MADKVSTRPFPYAAETPLERAAVKITRTLANAGYQAYFVGGCVRDRLLGNHPKDIDIATSAKPDEITALFSHTIPVGAAFGVITVVEDSFPFEVATFRAESDYTDGRRPDRIEYANAEADAVRRDFTFNALFVDPLTGTLIDFCDGLNDLEKGVVRAIGKPSERFQEDYLRMLRAIRFTSRLGFELHPETMEAIKESAPLIKGISRERIFAELNKMLISPNAELALELLSESGLLKELIPELEKQKGCPQPPKYHPEGDVWTHTKLLLENLPENPSPALAWSALLHDIAKPATLTFKECGTPAMPNHAKIGADMSEKLLLELRAPGKLTKEVTKLVYDHMRFADVQKMRPAKLRRLISEETFPTALDLHRIDCLSASGDLGNYNFLTEKMKEIEEEGESLALPDPLLTGADLIKRGLKPGPIFGKLLHEAMNLQLGGELLSKEEALSWLDIQISTKESDNA